MFFNKGDGYYSFLPEDVMNKVPPRILLTDLKIGGHSINPGKNAPFEGALENTREINLQYNQNSFSIDFTTIHYAKTGSEPSIFYAGGI